MKLEVFASSSLSEQIGDVKHIGMNTLLKKIDEYSLEPTSQHKPTLLKILHIFVWAKLWVMCT